MGDGHSPWADESDELRQEARRVEMVFLTEPPFHTAVSVWGAFLLFQCLPFGCWCCPTVISCQQ